MSELLKYIEKLRIEYWTKHNRIPTKLWLNWFILKRLKKELLYTGWGYHRIIYYKDSVSMLGMEILNNNYDYLIHVGE